MLVKFRVGKGAFVISDLMIIFIIIAILAILVVVALNPAKRDQDIRNSRRWDDVQRIAVAVQQYAVDNESSLPMGISNIPNQIGSCESGGGSLCPQAADKCLDLSSVLLTYLNQIPYDPSLGSSTTTGYLISKDNNFVTVTACVSEAGESISVSK